MKEVLVPMAYHELEADTIAPVSYARETYITKLAQYDMLPLFVSPAATPKQWDALFERANGVLLMGGVDVHASAYGQAPHPTATTAQMQDEMELYITRRALDEQVPLVGICRGVQVMAVAAGGELIQHVPEKYPDEYHGTAEAGSYNNVVEHHHDIHIDPDSRLFEIVAKEAITVNTGHHQAIKDPGDMFVVSATSPAGVIEAIERTDDEHFCFGVQSHPETQEDSFFAPLFAAFTRAL
jgi:putative glutamine amidotransferase